MKSSSTERSPAGHVFHLVRQWARDSITSHPLPFNDLCRDPRDPQHYLTDPHTPRSSKARGDSVSKVRGIGWIELGGHSHPLSVHQTAMVAFGQRKAEHEPKRWKRSTPSLGTLHSDLRHYLHPHPLPRTTTHLNPTSLIYLCRTSLQKHPLSQHSLFQLYPPWSQDVHHLPPLPLPPWRHMTTSPVGRGMGHW